MNPSCQVESDKFQTTQSCTSKHEALQKALTQRNYIVITLQQYIPDYAAHVVMETYLTLREALFDINSANLRLIVIV